MIPQTCSHCGQRFSNAGSYLRHRTPPWKPPQQCLPARELVDAGLERRDNGVWHFKGQEAS